MQQNVPHFDNNVTKHPLLWFVSNIDGKIYNTETKHCKVERHEFQGKIEWFVDVLCRDDAEGSFVVDIVIGYENLKELKRIIKTVRCLNSKAPHNSDLNGLLCK